MCPLVKKKHINALDFHLHSLPDCIAASFRVDLNQIDVNRAGDDVGPLAFVERQRRRQRQVGHGRVLAVAMSPQVDLALEGLVTESAGEWLVAGMLAHVGDQIGRLAEGFAAHDALVRLLTCNNRQTKRKHQFSDSRISNYVYLI